MFQFFVLGLKIDIFVEFLVSLFYVIQFGMTSDIVTWESGIQIVVTILILPMLYFARTAVCIEWYSIVISGYSCFYYREAPKAMAEWLLLSLLKALSLFTFHWCYHKPCSLTTIGIPGSALVCMDGQCQPQHVTYAASYSGHWHPAHGSDRCIGCHLHEELWTWFESLCSTWSI